MQVTGGDTNVTTYFMMRLTADGTAATGLTITTFDLQYTRTGAVAVTKVDATALANAGSVHADNKMVEVDATSSPGLYRVDWPDAAFAASVKQVHLSVKYDSTIFSEVLAVNIDAPVNVTTVSGTAEDLPTATALATAQTDLDTITGADGVNLLSATQASIDAIEADTNELQADDIPGTIAALNDLSLADIFTYVIENSETFEQQLRLMRAESCGKVAVSGATVTFRNAADDADRITATTDSTGQRTAVTVVST